MQATVKMRMLVICWCVGDDCNRSTILILGWICVLHAIERCRLHAIEMLWMDVIYGVCGSGYKYNMALVSQDIFYEVKKQILDKLDVILQKINLEIINYIRPEQDEFNFIELSYFQTEITHLFTYLDRLYASLNSSVSFSSIQSYKESAENYQAENQRLTNQNLKLKQIIHDINLNPPSKSSEAIPSEIQLISLIRAQSLVKLQPLRLKINSLKGDLSNLGKIMKKVLKSYKFQMLQSRVEIISRLKDWSQEGTGRKKQMVEKECYTELQDHGHFDAHEILEALDQIISIC